MMSSFSRIRESMDDDLQTQVANLRKEVSSLTKIISKQSANAYAGTRDHAADLYEEVWNRLSEALPLIGKQARLANKTVHDNPVATAVVGVALVGLLIGLLARR